MGFIRKYTLLLRACMLSTLMLLVISSKAADTTLRLKTTIRGGLSPKSVVHSGQGLFFAQNMMYKHTISVYDQHYRLRKTISDKIDPVQFGISDKSGMYRGAPVECAFSPDGNYAYVSNYVMEGEGFDRPGCDTCSGKDYDHSFIYKISTKSLEIENVIRAGSVPKFLAVSPDNKYLLVSNWTSADVSVIDLKTEKEIKKLHVGRFPRGIAIDSESKYAYVAVMGSNYLQRIDLKEMKSEKYLETGRAPRHVCIDSKDSFLYVTVNNEGMLARINLHNGETKKLAVGGTPRSMTMGEQDKFLYVVNYSSSTFTKVDLTDFRVKEKAATGKSPIGITYNPINNEIWVACYSGSLMIYKDTEAPADPPGIADFFNFGPVIDDFYTGIHKLFQYHQSDNAIPLSNSALGESALADTEQPLKKVAEAKSESVQESTATETANKKPESENGNFYVIVGSFKNPDNADRQADLMKKKGYSCKTIENNNGFHYAAVGAFATKENAADKMKSIRTQHNIEGWVWEKK